MRECKNADRIETSHTELIRVKGRGFPPDACQSLMISIITEDVCFQMHFDSTQTHHTNLWRIDGITVYPEQLII